MTLFNSNGLLSGISHSKVVPTPAIIEDTPPAMLTRFQKKTASKAGVSPAPYTVYAYICTSRTVGKKRDQYKRNNTKQNREKFRHVKQLFVRCILFNMFFDNIIRHVRCRRE